MDGLGVRDDDGFTASPSGVDEHHDFACCRPQLLPGGRKEEVVQAWAAPDVVQQGVVLGPEPGAALDDVRAEVQRVELVSHHAEPSG
ncbi:hypothetical protein FXN61_44180 [Lentzea sp. PSKA42]|uniref:Uncharacterized protein n=1 Tax=Lentzea indica TaxID=2604800 RepID=A0ABX1FWB9_9PSEU|nr:hypothetical protein [Lentzea indica]NKE63353.1 hypothetical protein [Lentzea indica]